MVTHTKHNLPKELTLIVVTSCKSNTAYKKETNQVFHQYLNYCIEQTLLWQLEV